MESRRVTPSQRAGHVVFFNDDEIEALKDLATSMAEHAGSDFWEGFDFESTIEEMRNDYYTVLDEQDGDEDDEATQLRDNCCVLAVMDMCQRIISMFGQGNTHYAIDPDFDMDRELDGSDYDRTDARTDRNHVVVDRNGIPSYRNEDGSYEEDLPF